MNVSLDDSYQLLAARYVRKQGKQLVEQLDGIRREDDIEFIHRARVASRRLRSALRMFRDCFDRKTVKAWRKEIRRLTSGLGDARDKDVQIEFICDVLCRLEERSHYPGVARLLVKLQHERELLQPKVLKAVDRFRGSPVPAELISTAKAMVDELEKRGVPLQSDFVYRQAERHIVAKLEKLLDYRSSLSDPSDQQRHHAMRIAAKRLRYTMEICKPAYDNLINDFISTTKEVQTLLGDIHDCDVWIENLAELLEEERQQITRHFGHEKPLARLQVGIDYLREDRRRQRRQLFDKLVQYWEEVERMRLWDDLRETFRPRSEVPHGDQPAAGPPGPAAAQQQDAGPPEQAANAGNGDFGTAEDRLPQRSAGAERALDQVN